MSNDLLPGRTQNNSGSSDVAAAVNHTASAAPNHAFSLKPAFHRTPKMT
jgi:hypothetical protein